MKKEVKKILELASVFVLINTFSAVTSYAQTKTIKVEKETRFASKGGGGGRDYEVAITNQEVSIGEIFLKIKRFFTNNPELKNDFPEVNINDLIEKIDNLSVEISLKDQIDKYGIPSTALNFPSLNLIRYNHEALKEAIKKPELIFVLSFHELLGLLGVEESNPQNEFIIESYPISSRLAKYVKRASNYDLIFEDSSDSTYEDEDSDPFINVGEGVTVKLLKALNIKPNTTKTKLSNNCWLSHNSVDFYRSLSAPQKFGLKEIYGLSVSGYKHHLGFFFTGLNSADLIFCSVEGKEYSSVTLGNMKRYLDNVIEFTFADPVEMD